MFLFNIFLILLSFQLITTNNLIKNNNITKIKENQNSFNYFQEEKEIKLLNELLIIEEHPYILFARNIYSWLVPSMILILLMAAIGNGIIVISAPLMSGEASHYNWLCISLAGADCWASTLLIIGLLVNSYIPIVMKISWEKGKCIAAFLEIFRISGMLTSNLHILALSFNQFLGICYPLLYKTTISTERIRILILFIWLIPIGFVGIWFISIPGDNLFSINCKYEFYTHLPFRLYIFIIFASILFLTFLLYGIILIHLLKQKALHKFRRNIKQYKKRLQSKLKLLTTTLLILSTFTLSWGVCVLYFLLVCKTGCPFIYLESISFQNGFLLNSTVSLKLVINPLIYALRMCHIRRSMAILFWKTINSQNLLSTQLFSASTAYATISRQLSPPRPLSATADLRNENNNSLLLLSAAQKHFQKQCSKCGGSEENNIKNIVSSKKGGGHVQTSTQLLTQIDNENIYLTYSPIISANATISKIKNKNINWRNFVAPSFEEVQSCKGILEEEKIQKRERRMTK